MNCSAKGCGRPASVFVQCSVKIEGGDEKKVALPIFFCELDKEAVKISDTAVTDELRQSIEKSLPDRQKLDASAPISFDLAYIISASVPKEIEKAIQRFGNTFRMFDQINGSHTVKAQAALRLSDAAIDAARVIRNYPADAGKAERSELAAGLTNFSAVARKAWKIITQKHDEPEALKRIFSELSEQGRTCGELFNAVLSTTPSGN